MIMRKILFVLALAMIGLITFAQVSVPVYSYTGNASDARAYISDPAGGSCNKRVWEIPITVEAQIAQWVEWSLTGTKWTWFVRKPGIYVANCITAVLRSNGNLGITFSGFDHLKYVQGNSVDDTIEVEYAFGPQLPPQAWIPAPDLNNLQLVIEDSSVLHRGATYKLWNRIYVERCNSASTYRDSGTITLTLLNQKPWIDDEGNFVEDLEEYVQ